MDSSAMMRGEHGQALFDDQLLDHIRQRRTKEALEILKNTPNASQLVDSEGRTLLHYAAEFGNHDLIWHLMESGALIDSQDDEGKSPLMLATDQTTINQLLLYHKANMHLRDKNGNCAFQLSLGSNYVRSFLEAIRLEYRNDVEKIAKKLIEFNCSIYTALTLQDSRVIALLLQNDCPLVPPSSALRPGDVLVKAVVNLDSESVSTLLDHKIDVDAEDSNGDTALCSYTMLLTGHVTDQYLPFYDYRSTQVFQLLLDRGANPSKIVKGEMQMSQFLKFGSKNAIEILLKAVDLNATDVNGRTALHYMAVSNYPRFYEFLKDREFNVNVRDNDGCTPLHCVNVKNFFNAIFLLDKGADIHAKNNFGMTALMSIWQRCRFSMFINEVSLERSKQLIENLLYREADVQAVTSDGKFSLFKKFSMCKVSGQYHVRWMPSVLAHLVMIEARGTTILKHVRKRIKKCNSLKKRLDFCKKQLRRMKKDKVWKSISPYQLLVEKDCKIERYARNKRLLRKLDRLKVKNKYVSYYRYILRKRFVWAAKIVSMRQKVAAELSKIIRVCVIVADKIISYISENDLRRMVKEEQLN